MATTITQDMRFRQSVVLWAMKHSVTSAAIRYKTNRQFVYRWLKRYDGDIHSLADLSRRPHHHPNQHSDQEIKLIDDMRLSKPAQPEPETQAAPEPAPAAAEKAEQTVPEPAADTSQQAKKQENSKPTDATAVATPAPAVQPDKKETTSEPQEYWILQLGAFGMKNNAELLVNNLKKQGIKGTIEERAGETKTLYLVQTGKFETKESAVDFGAKKLAPLNVEFRAILKKSSK